MKQLLKLLGNSKKRKLHGQLRSERALTGMNRELTKMVNLKQGVISMSTGR